MYDPNRIVIVISLTSKSMLLPTYRKFPNSVLRCPVNQRMESSVCGIQEEAGGRIHIFTYLKLQFSLLCKLGFYVRFLIISPWLTTTTTVWFWKHSQQAVYPKPFPISHHKRPEFNLAILQSINGLLNTVKVLRLKRK